MIAKKREPGTSSPVAVPQVTGDTTLAELRAAIKARELRFTFTSHPGGFLVYGYAKGQRYEGTGQTIAVAFAQIFDRIDRGISSP